MKILLSLLFLLPLTALARYQSTAVVQVHPSMIAINPLGNNAPILPHKDYMEKEFETVVAPETLRAALSLLQPKGSKEPITDEAIAILRKKITSKPRRGTDFIEIIATADSKNEAIKLSNAVANAYMSRRKEAEISRAEAALDALDKELLAQSDLVQEARKELTVLIQQYGIPYSGGHENPLGMTEKEMLKNARRKLDEFEVMRDQLEIQINKIVALKEDKLMFYAAGLDFPDNQITQSYIQYQEARTELLALFSAGLNPDNPKIKKAKNRSRKLKAGIQKEVVQLQAYLKTKLELIDRQVKRMKEMVYNKDQDTTDLSLKQSQYNQAKESYEQSRTMLREMKIRQQEARVFLKMPRDPVTIHERAK